MAQEDVDGGVASEGSGGDSKSSDEWVAPDEDLTVVIGRGEVALPTLPKRPEGKGVHEVVSIEELRKPSPKPFQGRPDQVYSELDSLEPLYFPKFLLRVWGQEKFLASPYYATWREEVRRAEVKGTGDDFRKRDQAKKK